MGQLGYGLDEQAAKALADYISLRKQQPHFANARSIRNALDRARLRQANRVFELAMAGGQPVGADLLSNISEADIRASRVFTQATGH